MPKGPGTYGSKVGRPKKMGGGMMKKRQKFKSGSTPIKDKTLSARYPVAELNILKSARYPVAELKSSKRPQSKLIKGPH